MERKKEAFERRKMGGRGMVGNRNSIIPLAKGRGSLKVDGYTKYVQWTPAKIALFAVAIVIPYGGAVTAAWFAGGMTLALVVALPILAVGVIAGLMYWLARANF